jgi:hypothetical protein
MLRTGILERRTSAFIRDEKERRIPFDEPFTNAKLRRRMPAGIMKWSSAAIVANSNVDVRLLKKILDDILESATTCHIQKRFTKTIGAVESLPLAM